VTRRKKISFVDHTHPCRRLDPKNNPNLPPKPEEHDCDFDFKETGRNLLRKQNNKVEADRLGDRL
jgi:hypothetical protein